MTKKELDALHVTDIYSLTLFALYKLRDTKEYSTLSELAYVLDKDSMLKLFEYFGGLTIRIPTIKELTLVIDALILYNYIKIEGQPYEKAILALNTDEYKLSEVRDVYIKLCEVLKDYDFKRT